MANARIYRPAKTAMQSGRAKTGQWALDYEQAAGRFVDPLMGWTGSCDTRQQLTLRFDTKQEAIAFANKQGLDYIVAEPHERAVRPKSYADNFRYDRMR